MNTLDKLGILDSSDQPTLSESLLLDSRFHRVRTSPMLPVKYSPDNTDQSWQKPSSIQKWWVSVLLGLLFAILTSSFSYDISNGLAKSGGFSTYQGVGVTIWGLLIHTVIFILIVRLILW